MKKYRNIIVFTWASFLYGIANETYTNWGTMYPKISLHGNKKERCMYLIDRSVSHYTMYEEMYPIFKEDGYEPEYKYSLLYAEDVIWKYGIEDFFSWRSRMDDVKEVIEYMEMYHDN